MAALAGCFSAMLIVYYGWSSWTSIIVVLIVGIFFGVLTGLIVTILGVPSFIATLGMMYVCEGVVLSAHTRTPITGLPTLHRHWPRLCRLDPDPGHHVAVIILIGAFIFKFTNFDAISRR
jgi:ribose/xylose/arabinose/galactoside ABC-type transport system permease subunit